MDIQSVSSLALFGGKIAIASAAISTTLRYWLRSRSVSEKAHASMVQDLIQLRKSADEDLRKMVGQLVETFQDRRKHDLELQARITSLEVKLEEVARFLPHLLKLTAKFNENLESVRSRVKPIAPETVRVEKPKKNGG